MREDENGVIYLNEEDFNKFETWLNEEPTEEEIEGARRFIEDIGAIVDERGYL